MFTDQLIIKTQNLNRLLNVKLFMKNESDMPPQTRYDITHLLKVMQRLRDPEYGCSWDKKQTVDSLRSCLLEEVYELLDAIDSKNMAHIQEELGDVLFQLVFYAQLAQEQSAFTWADAVHAVCEKLIRRHPHVFVDGSLDKPQRNALTPAQVAEQWQAIKAQECTQQSSVNKGFLFANIPKMLPALLYASKTQSRAVKAGVTEHSDVHAALNALGNHLEQLTAAIDEQSTDAIAQTLGNVLFNAVDVARHAGVDPEDALRQATKVFRQHVEEDA